MRTSTFRLAACTALALAALLAWDLSGLDLALAGLSGTAQGFPLRDAPLLAQVLHGDAKTAAWLLVLLLCAAAIWPPHLLRNLPQGRRVQLAASALVATGAVTLLKTLSHTSCPWDLAQFGGVARHVSHWSGWLVQDGGAGHCFPAGHASTGFAFIGGFFALRHDQPRLAWVWLLIALVAGLGFGWVQQLRGAHFMSHTLWTGWICWILAWASDPLFARATDTPVQEAA